MLFISAAVDSKPQKDIQSLTTIPLPNNSLPQFIVAAPKGISNKLVSSSYSYILVEG